MRVLLVNPPNSGRSIPAEQYGESTIRQVFRGEPLALEVLAGNLPDHEVRILDLKVEPDAIESACRSFDPQVVGFTAMTCEARTVLRLAAQVRDCARARIVVGGVHASNDPEFFNAPSVDWVAAGLGKAAFREWIDGMERGEEASVPGFARCTPGTPLRFHPRRFSAVDLAEEAPPRYDLVAHYREHYVMTALNLRLGCVVTAAGCTHACPFCCVPAVSGGKYLPVSAGAVLRDLRLLADTPVVRLVDANSFGDAERARELGRAILESGLRKALFADVRADTVVRHPDLFREWREAGLEAAVIGFEEMDDARLRALGKRSAAGIHRRAIDILHGLGIRIVGDFIVNPDYAEGDFDRLRDFVRASGIEIPIFSILTPLPGTPLHRALENKIVIPDLDYYTLTNAVTRTRLPERDFYARYVDLVGLLQHPPRP